MSLGNAWCDILVHLGNGIDGCKNATTDGGSTAYGQAIQRNLQGFRVAGRRLDGFSKTRKCHQADQHILFLILNEGKRGFLGCLQAAG